MKENEWSTRRQKRVCGVQVSFQLYCILFKRI